MRSHLVLRLAIAFVAAVLFLAAGRAPAGWGDPRVAAAGETAR